VFSRGRRLREEGRLSLAKMPDSASSKLQKKLQFPRYHHPQKKALFVPQSFDWIQTRSAYGWNDATD
jgi:hypothetical protein